MKNYGQIFFSSFFIIKTMVNGDLQNLCKFDSLSDRKNVIYMDNNFTSYIFQNNVDYIIYYFVEKVVFNSEIDFNRFKNLKYLKINSSKMVNFNTNISQLRRIKKLRITQTCLKNLVNPHLLSNFLLIIDLSYNMIEFIQDNFFQNLIKVRNIYLNHNRIKTLDSLYFYSYDLLYISLSNNPIENLDRIIFNQTTLLTDLKIDLTYHHLKTIPLVLGLDTFIQIDLFIGFPQNEQFQIKTNKMDIFDKNYQKINFNNLFVDENFFNQKSIEIFSFLCYRDISNVQTRYLIALDINNLAIKVIDDFLLKKDIPPCNSSQVSKFIQRYLEDKKSKMYTTIKQIINTSSQFKKESSTTTKKTFFDRFKDFFSIKTRREKFLHSYPGNYFY